jgi:hypothetical protein
LLDLEKLTRDFFTGGANNPELLKVEEDMLKELEEHESKFLEKLIEKRETLQRELEKQE